MKTFIKTCIVVCTLALALLPQRAYSLGFTSPAKECSQNEVKARIYDQRDHKDGRLNPSNKVGYIEFRTRSKEKYEIEFIVYGVTRGGSRHIVDSGTVKFQNISKPELVHREVFDYGWSDPNADYENGFDSYVFSMAVIPLTMDGKPISDYEEEPNAFSPGNITPAPSGSSSGTGSGFGSGNKGGLGSTPGNKGGLGSTPGNKGGLGSTPGNKGGLGSTPGNKGGLGSGNKGGFGSGNSGLSVPKLPGESASTGTKGGKGNSGLGGKGGSSSSGKGGSSSGTGSKGGSSSSGKGGSSSTSSGNYDQLVAKLKAGTMTDADYLSAISLLRSYVSQIEPELRKMAAAEEADNHAEAVRIQKRNQTILDKIDTLGNALDRDCKKGKLKGEALKKWRDLEKYLESIVDSL